MRDISLSAELGGVLFIRRGAPFLTNAQALIAALIMWSGVATVFIGPISLLGSCYFWLREGEWVYFDNAVVLWIFNDLGAWVRAPNSWMGLHAIVSWLFRWVPVGMISVPVGLVIAIAGASFLPQVREKEAEANQTPEPTRVDARHADEAPGPRGSS